MFPLWQNPLLWHRSTCHHHLHCHYHPHYHHCCPHDHDHDHHSRKNLLVWHIPPGWPTYWKILVTESIKNRPQYLIQEVWRLSGHQLLALRLLHPQTLRHSDTQTDRHLADRIRFSRRLITNINTISETEMLRVCQNLLRNKRTKLSRVGFTSKTFGQKMLLVFSVNSKKKQQSFGFCFMASFIY